MYLVTAAVAKKCPPAWKEVHHAEEEGVHSSS
jgi:hypothetical protein